MVEFRGDSAGVERSQSETTQTMQCCWCCFTDLFECLFDYQLALWPAHNGFEPVRRKQCLFTAMHPRSPTHMQHTTGLAAHCGKASLHRTRTSGLADLKLAVSCICDNHWLGFDELFKRSWHQYDVFCHSNSEIRM